MIGMKGGEKWMEKLRDHGSWRYPPGVLLGQSFPPLGAAPTKYFAAVFGLHALTKTVYALAFSIGFIL